MSAKKQSLKTVSEINKNEVLSEMLNKFVEQTEKGVEKYGHTVQPNELSTIEWIEHAIEESIDHIVYLICLKKKLLEGEGK